MIRQLDALELAIEITEFRETLGFSLEAEDCSSIRRKSQILLETLCRDLRAVVGLKGILDPTVVDMLGYLSRTSGAETKKEILKYSYLCFAKALPLTCYLQNIALRRGEVLEEIEIPEDYN